MRKVKLGLEIKLDLNRLLAVHRLPPAFRSIVIRFGHYIRDPMRPSARLVVLVPRLSRITEEAFRVVFCKAIGVLHTIFGSKNAASCLRRLHTEMRDDAVIALARVGRTLSWRSADAGGR